MRSCLAVLGEALGFLLETCLWLISIFFILRSLETGETEKLGEPFELEALEMPKLGRWCDEDEMFFA